MIHLNNYSNNSPCFQIKFQQHYCLYPYTLEKGLKLRIFPIPPHNFNLIIQSAQRKGELVIVFRLKTRQLMLILYDFIQIQFLVLNDKTILNKTLHVKYLYDIHSFGKDGTIIQKQRELSTWLSIRADNHHHRSLMTEERIGGWTC